MYPEMIYSKRRAPQYFATCGR